MNSKEKTGRATKATTTTTAVATTNTKALDALEMVRERIKMIKVVVDAPMRTHGQFKYSPTSSAASIIDIHKTLQVEPLLHILGFVMEKEQKYNNAAKACGLSEYPLFTWCGYGWEAWAHDIKVRVAIIQSTANLAQLESAERELSGFLSQDDKLTMLLSRLGNLLG